MESEPSFLMVDDCKIHTDDEVISQRNCGACLTVSVAQIRATCSAHNITLSVFEPAIHMYLQV
jgi:hypothetical protein